MVEIITKAVIGKAKISGSKKQIIESTIKPNTILGCWIINHNVNSKLDKETVIVNGSYDINIWYSYNNNTQTSVLTKKIEYQEKGVCFLSNNIIDKNKIDTIINCYKQPTATDAKILDDGQIQVYVSKGIEVEVVGEVKIKIEESK